MLVMRVDDFKNVPQSNSILVFFVEARRASEKISSFEHVLVLCSVSDVDWCCESKFMSDPSMTYTKCLEEI